jgi:hypothetical protein
MEHGLLTLRHHMGSLPVFGGVCIAHHFSFVCCVVVFCLSSSCVLSSPMLPMSLECSFLIVPSVFSAVYLLSG